MQSIARWTNLSETTFVLPPTHPDADYRVRIFTIEGELPFAGHPTLGTAHALLEAGHQPKTPGRMVQECGVGLVQIAIGRGGELAFAAPEATLSAWQHPGIAAALNSEAFDMQHTVTIVDMGIRWLLVPMTSAQAVLDINPDVPCPAQLLADAGVTGLMPFGPSDDGEVAYEVRGLLVEQGALTEDPVTGSANACPARYLAAQGMPQDYRRAGHRHSARRPYQRALPRRRHLDWRRDADGDRRRPDGLIYRNMPPESMRWAVIQRVSSLNSAATA